MKWQSLLILKKWFPLKNSVVQQEALTRLLVEKRIFSEEEHMILSGKLRKGRKLYREKIAQDFDVGYTAVSEAFSRLKRDGLVIIKHSVGSFVA